MEEKQKFKIDINENNIKEFLLNLSLILHSNNNKGKNEYLNNFKEYLSLIFQSHKTINVLFNTLENLIFPNNKSNNNNNINNKSNELMINQKLLVLYPLIFDYEPKLSYNYINNFLIVLQKCSSLIGSQFLFYLFNQFINIYFNENENDDNGSTAISNNSKNKFPNKCSKEQLFATILNFCINLIECDYQNNYDICEKNNNYTNNSNNSNNSNEKQEFFLGFTFLSILIEKLDCCLNFCSIQNIISNLWSILSYFFNKKKQFSHIYDILYCTLKLILVSKEKFNSYCKLCLFTILDYLTDDNWQIRKISLEIIFFLTKFCKTEIKSVKDNIIEFLNLLKDDKVPQVKDICIQTLNLIEERNDNFRPIKNRDSRNNNQNLELEKRFENNNPSKNNEENINNEDEENNLIKVCLNNTNVINNPDSNVHIVNISILDCENEKNDSKDNILIFDTNNEKNTNEIKNYNDIINKNINPNHIINKNINNININRNNITNFNDDIEYEISNLKNRNYSSDNCVSNNNNKINIVNSPRKTKKAINLSIKKESCPIFNIEYMNKKKDLSISKLTYSVIQNNSNINNNNNTSLNPMNKEKTNGEFPSLKYLKFKKNKFFGKGNFLDISSLISSKNIEKTKLTNNSLTKKYIASKVKVHDQNNNESMSLTKYINKNKNKYKYKQKIIKNKINNNSMEYRHTYFNFNNFNKIKNEDEKKYLKEDGHFVNKKNNTFMNSNSNNNNSSILNKKVKEEKKIKKMKSKNISKEIIHEMKINKNKSLNKSCNSSVDKNNPIHNNMKIMSKEKYMLNMNNKLKKNDKINKSYLNFQKKFEKKSTNDIKQIHNNKNNNNIKNGNKIDTNNLIRKFKLFVNKKAEREKMKNSLEITPKINLLPLHTEDNMLNIHKNSNNNNNNNNIKRINALRNNNDNSMDMNNINSSPKNINIIADQLNTLYQGQNMLFQIINNLRDKVDINYKTITERLTTYEKNKTLNNNIRKRKTQINKNDINNNDNDDNKIEVIKQKYREGKFDDALMESIKNDDYLFKLLPMVKIEDIKKININLIEDIISRLSLKLTSIIKNNNMGNFRIILSFLNLVINSKIKLKIITKLNLEDSLTYIKNDSKLLSINNVELNLIENIITLIKKDN